MSIVVGTKPVLCNPGVWTALWESPTFGFTYVWATQGITIQWRRYASSPLWYMDGTANLSVGKNTVVTSGPAAYMRFEVKTSAPAILRAS